MLSFVICFSSSVVKLCLNILWRYISHSLIYLLSYLLTKVGGADGLTG